ncbi:MAG: hypothetical protein P8X74_20530 [Reinekea sp.]
MSFKNCRAPIGSPRFLASKEESMACALRRDGVTDSGNNQGPSLKPKNS